MGATFNIERHGRLLRIGLGDPALADAIVRDAASRLKEMADAHELDGGGIIGVNGPAPIPVAVVIAHAIAHLFSAVAMWVPALDAYVVSISHDPDYTVGQLLDRSVIEGTGLTA